MKYIAISTTTFFILFNLFIVTSYSETHPAISKYDKYLEAINSAQKLYDLNQYISKRKIEVYGEMTEDKKKIDSFF